MIKSTTGSKDLKPLIQLDTNGFSGDKSDFRHKNETIFKWRNFKYIGISNRFNFIKRLEREF